MRSEPRQVNMKKFLTVFPVGSPSENGRRAQPLSSIPKYIREAADVLTENLTLWAPIPETVPSRVRRAADIYLDMALRGQQKRNPLASGWQKVAEILTRAAEDLEAAFPASA